MICPDTRRRQFQRRPIRSRDFGTFGGNLFGRKRHGTQIKPVKLAGQLNQGRITARPDIRNDRRHRRINILSLFPLHAQHGGKTGFKIGVLGGQKQGHDSSPQVQHPYPSQPLAATETGSGWFGAGAGQLRVIRNGLKMW